MGTAPAEHGPSLPMPCASGAPTVEKADGKSKHALFLGSPTMAWTDIDLVGAGSMGPGGGVAAIAKDARSTDTFWVAADGSVRVASYEPGTAWAQSTLGGPGGA